MIAALIVLAGMLRVCNGHEEDGILDFVFFFEPEDGIQRRVESRGPGDVYRKQTNPGKLKKKITITGKKKRKH